MLTSDVLIYCKMSIPQETRKCNEGMKAVWQLSTFPLLAFWGTGTTFLAGRSLERKGNLWQLLLWKGPRGDFASADARFRLCGGDQRAFRSPFGHLRPPLISSIEPKRWQVAAALSAAVTTTKQQETALTFRRNQLRRNVPPQAPAALRERGSGGEVLFSEKRPLPQNLPIQVLREGARGRGFSQRSRLPRNHPVVLYLKYSTPPSKRGWYLLPGTFM